MVKGTNRQVVVVRGPDPRLFDEAIFLVRADAAQKEGVSEQELLQQAQKAADGYLGQTMERRRLPGVIWALLGAVAMGLVWLMSLLL